MDSFCKTTWTFDSPSRKKNRPVFIVRYGSPPFYLLIPCQRFYFIDIDSHFLEGFYILSVPVHVLSVGNKSQPTIYSITNRAEKNQSDKVPHWGRTRQVQHWRSLSMAAVTQPRSSDPDSSQTSSSQGQREKWICGKRGGSVNNYVYVRADGEFLGEGGKCCSCCTPSASASWPEHTQLYLRMSDKVKQHRIPT